MLVLFLSCAGISKAEQEQQMMPISKSEFADKPFGFDLTLTNFEENYKGVLKRQRYFRTIHYTGNVDTIYSFYKGKKTKILFYKYGRFEARLMGGKIRKPKVELHNSIRTGLSRREFFAKFTDWHYDDSNILTLDSPATRCTFTFVFSRSNKLKEIRFTVRQSN